LTDKVMETNTLNTEKCSWQEGGGGRPPIVILQKLINKWCFRTTGGENSLKNNSTGI